MESFLTHLSIIWFYLIMAPHQGKTSSDTSKEKVNYSVMYVYNIRRDINVPFIKKYQFHFNFQMNRTVLSIFMRIFSMFIVFK